MKKIALISFGFSLVLLTWVATAQDEAKSSKSKASNSAATSEHKMMLPDELQWSAAPPGLPPGAQMALLDGDPTKPGSFTVRLKTPAGYKIMPHTHPTPERITVISGTFHVSMGEKFDENAGRELGQGGFVVLPARMAHFAWSKDETIVQINSEGPFQIKYVNAADDPRGAKK